MCPMCQPHLSYMSTLFFLCVNRISFLLRSTPDVQIFWVYILKNKQNNDDVTHTSILKKKKQTGFSIPWNDTFWDHHTKKSLRNQVSSKHLKKQHIITNLAKFQLLFHKHSSTDFNISIYMTPAFVENNGIQFPFFGFNSYKIYWINLCFEILNNQLIT